MRRPARAVGVSLLTLLITLPWANAAQAPSLEVSRWSRPVPVIMTRVEARPALVVDRSGRIHLFYIDLHYLDRVSGPGLVRWVTTDLDGRITHPPRVLGPADLRAKALAAAGAGGEIHVAWVEPSGEGMRLVQVRLRPASGPVEALPEPEPLGLPAEDAGPVSLVSSPAGVHAVWSQVRDGRREVWYRGPDRTPAALVGPGDAPAVSVGPSGPVVVWWQRTGFDTTTLRRVRDGAARFRPSGRAPVVAGG